MRNHDNPLTNKEQMARRAAELATLYRRMASWFN